MEDRKNRLDSLPNPTSFKSWLSHSWLKNDVYFDTLEVEYNRLYLTLRFRCDRSCTQKWFALKSSFDSLSSTSFDFYIWNKAAFHLESDLPLVVEIYNQTKPFEAPCFLRSIYYQDSIHVVKVDCKDLGGTSNLDYGKFNPSFHMNKLSKSNHFEKASQILDTIFSKADKFYKTKGKDISVVIKLKEPERIIFIVSNLKSEVLTKRNTIEKLEVAVTCNLKLGNANFEVLINGKYGSYRIKPVRDIGYNDMENDYSPELQLYVDEFVNQKIISWVK